MRLDVYAELGGERVLVGLIETVQAAGARFAYSPEWLASRRETLSSSLPLQAEPYPEKKMRPYFDGLLPEGAAREALARAARTSTRSYVKLLAALGDECIGAVSFGTAGREPDEGYSPFSDDDLEALARKGYASTTPINSRAHMSIAGAQAKVGLYRTADGSWREPHGGAPSTHILKPLNPRFENAQINEAICQLAAGRCGLPVPDTEIIPTAVPLLCTRRFDRVFLEDAHEVDGMIRPTRLHQEDACQALGIVPEHKYEEGNHHYLGKIAQLIREQSAQPLEDLRNLWKLTVFNYLIGNCDAHLKNIGFVRSASWRETSLSPFYDLVSTALYDSLSDSLAMSVGGKRKLSRIDRGCFEREADSIHIASREAERVMESLIEAVPDAVRDSARELDLAGLPAASSLGDRIASQATERAKSIRT